MNTEINIKSQLDLMRTKLSEAQNLWKEHMASLDIDREALRRQNPELLPVTTHANHEPVLRALARLQAIGDHHEKRAAVCERRGIKVRCLSVQKLLIAIMLLAPMGPATPMWQLKIAIAFVSEVMQEEALRLSYMESAIQHSFEAFELQYLSINVVVAADFFSGDCSLEDTCVEWDLQVNVAREELGDAEFRSIEEGACTARKRMNFDGGMYLRLNELALWMSQLNLRLARQTLITEYFLPM